MKFRITFVFMAILSFVISHYISTVLIWWSTLVQPFTPFGKIFLTWSVHIVITLFGIGYAWTISGWLTDKNKS